MDTSLSLSAFSTAQRARDEADQVERAIDLHHGALSRRDDPASALSDVADAKRALERLLRPVIARTERATAISGELFDRWENAAQVEAGDLVTFRHLARAVARRKGALRSWVQPLWSSVPYPAETLFRYQICKALGSDLPPVTIASGGDRPAHPQLRALVDPRGREASTLSPDVLGAAVARAHTALVEARGPLGPNSGPVVACAARRCCSAATAARPPLWRRG